MENKEYERKQNNGAREHAHDRFDLLWRGIPKLGVPPLMKRGDAYKWLAKFMGVSPKDAHFSHFTSGQCDRVADFLDKQLKKLFETRDVERYLWRDSKKVPKNK